MTPSDPNPPRILLVEDSPTQSAMLRRVLEAEGWAVDDARNGAEGYCRALEGSYDLVLSDCRMPVLDGFQLCRLLKDTPRFAARPVLLLTAEEAQGSRFWARTCGADQFLIKEGAMEGVTATVRKALADRSSLVESREQQPEKCIPLKLENIQHRLASALEHRLLEVSLRNAIVDLGQDLGQSLEGILWGVMEILSDLVGPARITIRLPGNESGERLLLETAEPLPPALEAACAGLQQELGMTSPGREHRRARLSSLALPDTWATFGRRQPLSEASTDLVWGLALGADWLAEINPLLQVAAGEIFRLVDARWTLNVLQGANRQLTHMVIEDSLTGLFNRRYFDSMLDSEWRRAHRQGDPVTVLYCDIDHFKHYNDYFGHPEGDVCLQQVAKLMQATFLRAGEVAARYGGEEFTVLLPGTSKEQGMQAAERFRSALEDLHLPHHRPDGQPFVTVSIGLCSVVPSPSRPISWIMAMADAALYESKQGGRNRVTGRGELDEK